MWVWVLLRVVPVLSSYVTVPGRQEMKDLWFRSRRRQPVAFLQDAARADWTKVQYLHCYLTNRLIGDDIPCPLTIVHCCFSQPFT
ncbi:hypothetical protein BCAR13_910012 [Paraburkholderia caribensis]|nr:hypothetical protein BCAR13_910012 [Paraburkholderia caribensis]